MQFRLLGDLDVRAGDTVVAVRGAKQRLLLALLALRRGESVSTDVLVDALWGFEPPANPANALQAQVSALRKVLPEPRVVTRGPGYALVVEPDELDVARFERLVADGRARWAAGDAAGSAATLREALALWRGEALADLRYEDSVRREIARLEELRLTALEGRIDADLALGRHGDLVAELDAVCRAHPLREHLRAQHIVALYRSGRQADALRAYGEARRHLVDELGIEPGAELRRLETLVLAQSPDLDVVPVATPAAPGAHGAAAVPAPGRRGNLRDRLDRFVGREREVADLGTVLAAQRLVTLVGPGGAGKTRLAAETGRVVAARYPDGVWMVELAAVAEPAGVTPAIAAALGVSDAAARPQGTADHAVRGVEPIVAHLTDRTVLVVLDNCEHVIGEAAHVVEDLLGLLPGLTVLATSREALGVPGEVLRPVGPLAPGAAADLFIERALAVAPGFALDDTTAALVAEIVRRLDGLPLALELAAARLRALPLADVAGRLDDRFRLLTGGARTALPRQQTLRAVVDWSYDLLFDDERRVFARLAAFVGGARLDAAGAVCGAEHLEPADVVELLIRLVERSLVTTVVDPDGAPRYDQLQTLWQYGRERLVDSGEAGSVRNRHAAWFLARARWAEQALRGAEGPTVRRLVASDLANFRAALDWFVERGDAASAVDLAVRIAWAFFLEGEFQEATRWIDDALAAPGPLSTAERATATSWRSYFRAVTEGGPAPLEEGRAAVEVLAVEGTPLQYGSALLLYTSTLNRAQRPQETMDLLDAARAALTESGDGWGLAMADLLAANALVRLDRFDEAATAATSAVHGFERVGERMVIIEPLATVASLQEISGDLDAALAGYERIIETARAGALPAYLTYFLDIRGALAARLGDDAGAMERFAEAIEISHSPVNTAFALIGSTRVAARRGDLAGHAERLERAAALFRHMARPDGEAVALVVLGLCRLDGGDAEHARRCLAEARGFAGHEPYSPVLAAALALHDGDGEEARRILGDVAGRYASAVPGSLPSVLRPDYARIEGAAGRT